MKKLIKTAKLYLRKNDIKTSAKRREEKIKGVIKEILLDKSPKEAIKMFQDIEILFNERLDEELKNSIETVEAISNYKKI